MIEFPNKYPYNVTNTAAETHCDIPAGQTTKIGTSNIPETLNIYNSYADTTIDNFLSGLFTSTDANDNILSGYEAASAFSNMRSKISEHQKCDKTQVKNITVEEYVKIIPMDTATRDNLNAEVGMQILNSDTNSIEMYNGTSWEASTGSIGPQGEQGDIGPQGFQGDDGIQGDQGFQGETGLGDQGPQGYQGDNGVQGDTGLGEQGEQGPQGYQGTIIDTNQLVYNATGTEQVTKIEVVTSLPTTPTSGTLYFIME